MIRSFLLRKLLLLLCTSISFKHPVNLLTSEVSSFE
ncbi:hypothetical protein ACJW30_06G174800 [Castanea mollissima]